MRTLYLPLFLMLLTFVLAACTSKQGAERSETAGEGPKFAHFIGEPTQFIGNNRRNVKALPLALVYRTRADYRHLVPVTLSADGKTLSSYPAPSDVNPTTSTPLALNDGYLLDRRGISVRTAFLDYTYDEYAALPSVPPVDTLLAHIIDRQPLTSLVRLPIHAHEAAQNLDTVNTYIDNGFEDCEVLIPQP